MLPKGWKRASPKSVVGTNYKGAVDVSYRKLVNTFGKPKKGDGYKTDAEWYLKSPAGKIVTIYNYKDGKAYLGKRGRPVSQLRDWHIGGKANGVVQDVRKALGI